MNQQVQKIRDELICVKLAWQNLSMDIDEFLGMEPGEQAGDVGTWRTTDEKPEDGEMVVVITKDNCMYFQTAHNGELMKNVKLWLRLPQIPK